MTYPSALRKKELAQDKRALRGKQEISDGMDPVWKLARLERDAKRQRDLILYAAAMGRKWGTLPIDLHKFHAFDVRNGDTASVYFTPGKYVNGRYGPEWRAADRDETSILVTVCNLDWQPAEPVFEEIREAA